MKVSRVVALGFGCFSAFLGLSDAFALTTSYGGLGCKVALSTTQPVSYMGAEAITMSSSNSYFTCPAHQTSSAPLVSARVVGKDLTPVGKVTCSIYDVSETAGGGFVSPSQSSTLGGMSNFAFDYKPLQSVAGGSRYVSCQMPPWSGEGSSITGYTFVEE